MLEFSFAQNLTKIVFENTTDFTNANLDAVPDHFKKSAVEQANKYITITHLFFNSNKEVWYESVKDISLQNKSSNEETVKLNLMNTPPQIRIYKNFNTNTCEFLEDNVVNKTAPMDLKWQVTNDEKLILGYHCKKATADYKGKKMWVYFTTKLKGEASPGFMNAVNGVVLEYDNTSKHGIATKIFFNEPNTKKFF